VGEGTGGTVDPHANRGVACIKARILLSFKGRSISQTRGHDIAIRLLALRGRLSETFVDLRMSPRGNLFGRRDSLLGERRRLDPMTPAHHPCARTLVPREDYQ